MSAKPDKVMTNDGSTVSVIIPAFNHQDYIEEALRSVLAQSWRELEIIVVDDGSTDDTARIAEQVLQSATRPHRLVRQSNRGAHAAINKGLELARGRFLTILNSDDFYHPERLSVLVRAATDTGRRMLFSAVRHVGPGGEPVPDEHPMVACYRCSLEAARLFPTETFELLRYNFAITSGNLFFERSLFEQIGLFRPLRFCHDWDFLLRSVVMEEPLFIREPLICYRVHGGNTILQGKDVEVVGGEETRQVRGHYLDHARHPANPLAPCAHNWGPYWVYFIHRFTDLHCSC